MNEKEILRKVIYFLCCQVPYFVCWLLLFCFDKLFTWLCQKQNSPHVKPSSLPITKTRARGCSPATKPPAPPAPPATKPSASPATQQPATQQTSAAKQKQERDDARLAAKIAKQVKKDAELAAELSEEFQSHEIQIMQDAKLAAELSEKEQIQYDAWLTRLLSTDGSMSEYTQDGVCECANCQCKALHERVKWSTNCTQVIPVPGKGNCLFITLILSEMGMLIERGMLKKQWNVQTIEQKAAALREKLATTLKMNRPYWSGFVVDGYIDEVIKQMRKNGNWGGNFELAVYAYINRDFKFSVIQPTRTGDKKELVFNEHKCGRPDFMIKYYGNHYEPIVRQSCP